MSTRKFSTSFGSDDEPQATSVHYNVHYVRRPLSPKRNNSFERIRPQGIGRGRSEQRSAQSFRSGSSESDDDCVYKVDRCGRRYCRSSRRRSRSRQRHQGRREGHPYMSGGLHVESESDSGHQSSSSSRQTRSSREPSEETCATTAGPFKIGVVQPQGDQKDGVRCKCRRCHRGRPGSQHDHKHRKSEKHDRSSKSRPPHRRTTTPRGILRKEPSNHNVRPKLRKTVSFEDGTKLPHRREERSHTSSSDDQRRRSRSKLPRRHSRANKTRSKTEDLTTDDFLASNTQSSGTGEGSSTYQSPSSEYEVELPGLHRCSDPGIPQEARCKSCHHCPVGEPRRKKRRQPSQPSPIRQSSPATEQADERLRSVAHSVLMSTHQSWCRGHCGNFSKFARKMGGCSACRRRRPDTRRTPSSRSIPNCRTLIRCRKFIDTFSGEETAFMSGENFDRALRFGYTDVYCCAIPASLTVEEYLAYQIQQVDDHDFGVWVRDGIVRKQMETIKRLGSQGVDARVPPGPGRKFFMDLAKEVDKTKRLWMTIMQNARMSGQPWGEVVVIRMLEDMTGRWKPRWIREEYEWFWN